MQRRQWRRENHRCASNSPPCVIMPLVTGKLTPLTLILLPQPSSKDETEDGKELEQCRRPRQEAVARGGETDQLEQRVPVQSSPRQSESTGAAAEGDEGEAEGTAWRHPWELAVSDNTVRDMHRTGFRRRKFKGAEQQRGKPPDEEEQQGFKGQESCFASAFSSENGEVSGDEAGSRNRDDGEEEQEAPNSAPTAQLRVVYL